MRPPRLSLALLFVLGSAISACDRAPSADRLKTWTPADHDGEKKGPSTTQGPRGAASSGPNLVELAWRQQCSSCHGAAGHGDGPQGPMYKARDLSPEAWQASIKDEEIAASIKNGKGKMPKFDLPDEVISGLVARVRSFRGK